MIRSIANLEVDCYTSCVDVTDIKNDLNSVRYEASYVCRDDEELEAAFNKFYSTIENQDATYVALEKVEEVKQI